MPASPEDRFAELVDALAGLPGVTPPEQGPGRRFGSAALKVDGRIFAMLVDDRLVLKLPLGRVSELVTAGEGEHFERGGRPMREWLALDPESAVGWLPLAQEARAFVAG
ncbi:hypothetical protein [Kitasatospora sp. NPDC050543]|uniref:hypothetical protein n=1 Tax=Kitasatospora sp. NPDC050543 TaxID=3364054 RepID=UPI0037B4E50C